MSANGNKLPLCANRAVGCVKAPGHGPHECESPRIHTSIKDPEILEAFHGWTKSDPRWSARGAAYVFAAGYCLAQPQQSKGPTEIHAGCGGGFRASDATCERCGQPKFCCTVDTQSNATTGHCVQDAAYYVESINTALKDIREVRAAIDDAEELDVEKVSTLLKEVEHHFLGTLVCCGGGFVDQSHECERRPSKQ